MVFQNRSNSARGFSLVELVVTIGIFSLFATISTSIFRTTYARSDLDIAAQSVASAFRHARTNAERSKEDSAWGVKISPDSIVVFKGNAYANRDASVDQSLTFPRGVGASGLSEIVFNKVSGAPNSPGTSTLSSAAGTREVSINEKGTVTY